MTRPPITSYADAVRLQDATIEQTQARQRLLTAAGTGEVQRAADAFLDATTRLSAIAEPLAETLEQSILDAEAAPPPAPLKTAGQRAESREADRAAARDGHNPAR